MSQNSRSRREVLQRRCPKLRGPPPNRERYQPKRPQDLPGATLGAGIGSTFSLSKFESPYMPRIPLNCGSSGHQYTPAARSTSFRKQQLEGGFSFRIYGGQVFYILMPRASAHRWDMTVKGLQARETASWKHDPVSKNTQNLASPKPFRLQVPESFCLRAL